MGVQFGLLNPDTVRQQSVVPIVTSVLYSKQVPQSGGMNDLRMGTCDRRTYCATCRNSMIKCPGHFGHMDLATPMYHSSMIGTVVKMLRCVCVFCSHLLPDLFEGDPRLAVVNPSNRLSFVASMCKSRRRCPQCEAPQPKYTNVKTHTSIDLDISDMVFEDETEREILSHPFTAARALEILKGISDTHVKIMGGCPKNARPEWMILTVLQIPPPISRPCITASDGSRTKGQDDVTIKLVEIFKANKVVDSALRDADCTSGFMPEVKRRFVIPDDGYLHIEDDAKLLAVQNASYILQQHLVQYFSPRTTKKDAKMMGTGGRSHSRTLRLIPDRWKGKKGRFRGNLGGKRVDFSSRTVASPAPDFDVNEVGIPEKVAFHLTFPERVTVHNKAWLDTCVRLGYGVRGGAASVIIPDSDPIDLELCTVRDSIVLEVGWVVERHLIDGDWVLLNRQPSLHKMSIMAHRIRIIPANTFRLPVCDTTPYNADFDGDELNVHVLQTHDARAEAEMLMSVSTQMISPENNKPIIALVQDSLVGGFLMTGKDTFLERHQAMQVIMSLRYLEKEFWLPPPSILKPRPLWTGKQLFSLLIPGEFMYDATVRSGVDEGVGKPGGHMDVMERRVILRGGELMCGSLCKKTLGTSAGGIVHVLVRDWGYKRAAEFMGDAQRLIREFMMIRGFSVGVGDCVMGMDTHARVDTLMSNTFKAADDIQKDSTASQDLVAGCVSKMLGGFLTSGGAEVVRDVNVTSGNRISVMIESGAKGSNINIAQILSSVGQQSVEGGRIQMGVEGRTLPSFRHGDTSACAMGFVCNSYGTGLTAQEYFFHAMGGREGLVDTAVKTAKTGYIQRRLSKAQEGLQVMYDSTVRNSGGGIIQFSYGGDSFFPTHLERVKLPTFKMDDQRLRAAVVGTVDEWAVTGPHATEFHAMALHQFEHLRADRDEARRVQLSHSKMAEGEMVMPFIPPRMFPRAAARFRDQHTPATPDQVHSAVTDLVTRIQKSKPDYTTTFVRIYARAHRTLRNLVVVHRLGREAIEWVCETIWRQYNEATAEYGEMVGTLGASSIGAPCTQMTLNSVDAETQLIVRWTASYPPPVPIEGSCGPWIDALVDARPGDVQLQPSGDPARPLAYLPLKPGEAQALSPTEDGKMVWTALEAVTRHPPLNKDGTETLLRVTTRDGRCVDVTKAKSVLVHRDGKLVAVDGDELKVGDDFCASSAHPETVPTLDLRSVFDPKLVLFTDLVHEARQDMSLGWFQKFKDRVPYSRSDSFRKATSRSLDPGRVILVGGASSTLPSEIALDRDFGFLVGAYLAEGCLTDFQVHISNNDEAYRNAAVAWTRAQDIGDHTKERHMNGGLSTSVIIHSKLLVDVLKHGCGSGSFHKHVPSWAFTAPMEFVSGLLDAYISGDGSIDRSCVTAGSRSRHLRDGIVTLFSNFGVSATLRESHVCGAPFYSVYVSREGAGKMFQLMRELTVRAKDELYQRLSKPTTKRALIRERMGDMVLDPVVSIEEVDATTPWVYDLTVEGTRNMTAGNGLGLRDTFHTAGVLAHTVTMGVPRLKELIDLSSIKTPSVRIFFDSPYNGSKRMAGMMAAGIEHTYLNQVVLTSEVVSQTEEDAGEDAHMVEMYTALRPEGEDVGSDVVIRYILDRDTLFRKQLTVEDVGKALEVYLGGNGVVMWSEVNTLQWCVRVRVRNTELEHVGVTDMALIHDFLMENVPVNGVAGIKRVILRNEKKRTPNTHTGGLDMDSIWVADTEGTNLAHILTLDGVHASKTFSNSIHETMAVLGIEAATHQLLNEIRCVLSHDGAYVNDRHLQVLVDVMTHGGVLSPVTRHNMSKLGASVYTRASFEQTQDVLTSGAIRGIKNKTNGVTENIMIGNTISGGTGCCEVITDKQAMPPPAPRTLVKALVRENKHVLPLNRIAKTSPLVHNKHLPGFVGKKRKNANPFEPKEPKKKRTLMLHSPQMRTGSRHLVLHSP